MVFSAGRFAIDVPATLALHQEGGRGKEVAAAHRPTTPGASMPIRLARALLLALLCLASGVHAQTAPEPAVLYHNYCSVCHGDRGDGKSRATGALSTPPRDFTSAASKQELTRERIALAIAHGRPGTAMVGWKTQLSANDIERLAEYVHLRFVQGQAPQAGATTISGTRAHGGREADAAAANASTSVPQVDMTAGLPNGLKGDPKRGGAFYLANCATCHGACGDGAGPRAYFINPKPRNFISDESRARFNRLALYAGISEGRLASEMPAWKQVATPQQVADVAEYVFQSFIRNEPAKAAAQTTR
jgi:mono/diheme cytochrome c family protein